MSNSNDELVDLRQCKELVVRDPQDPHMKLIRRIAQSLATKEVNERINGGLFSAAFQRILYPSRTMEAEQYVDRNEMELS